MIVWLVASPCVIAVIKHLTSNKLLAFPYPWLLVGFSNVGVWVLCSIVQYMPGTPLDNTVQVPWSKGLPMGLMQGVEIGIGTEILHQISITLRTEILMLCPALMFIATYFAGLERLEPRIVLAVTAVTIGGLMSCYGTMTSTGLTLVPIALFGSLISTGRWVFTQKWLSVSCGDSKPSPITLVQRMAPMTALVGFVVAYIRHPGCYQTLPALPHPTMVACLLSTIALLVCLMVFAEMRVVQLTSALMIAFMCPVHNISVIFMDASVRGTKIYAVNWIGIVVCALASGFYTRERLQDKEKDDQLPLQGTQGVGQATGYQTNSTEAKLFPEVMRRASLTQRTTSEATEETSQLQATSTTEA